MNKKLCVCSEPFPPCYPFSADGIECDNCGDWLTPDRANQAVIDLFSEHGIEVVSPDESKDA